MLICGAAGRSRFHCVSSGQASPPGSWVKKQNPEIQGISGFILICGAAGSRTRVQTVSKNAFYMLIFQLIVGRRPAESHPTETLFPLIFELLPGP